jgi:hypothetical protein
MAKRPTIWTTPGKVNPGITPQIDAREEMLPMQTNRTHGIK